LDFRFFVDDVISGIGLGIFGLGNQQGLKNCKFPRKLVEFPVGRKLETITPIWRCKRNLSSWKHCTQEPNYHCVHIGQLGLIKPTNIDLQSTCKQLHRRSVPHYRLVRQNEILKECKTNRSGKFSCL